MVKPEIKNCELHWTVDITGYRQLFVDNMVVARMENCSKKLHQLEKVRENPLIQPEHEWESHGLHGNVVYDKEENMFKSMYIPYCKADAIRGNLQSAGTCYAFSHDGYEWEKPKLGIFDWNGQDTNIIFKGACPDKKPGTLHEGLEGMIIVDNPPDAVEDRYRATALRFGVLNDFVDELYGYYMAHSEDGIHWKISPYAAISIVDNPDISDAHTLMYDSLKKRYICFTKKHKLCPDGIGDQGYMKRVRGISFSDDFVHFTKPQTMLLPDDRDDPDVNLYNVEGFVYEGQYLGLLSVYHSGLEGPKARTVDFQLISSRDGETWWRAGDRNTILPLGKESEWDCGQVRLTGSEVFLGPDGLLWAYYVGVSTHHIPIQLGYFPDDVEFRAVGLAKLRRDGFVSVDAGEEEGTLLTKRLRYKGSKLHVNADIGKDGYILAEVWKTRHEAPHPTEPSLRTKLDGVLRGFTRDLCAPISCDQLNAVIRWTDDPDLMPYGEKDIALKFYLKNASLYSFWIE